MGNGDDSPAEQVLRSLDVNPNARLVEEPERFAMRPGEVSRMTPEQRAERDRRVSELEGQLARNDRQRREASYKRRRFG